MSVYGNNYYSSWGWVSYSQAGVRATSSATSSANVLEQLRDDIDITYYHIWTIFLK